MRRLSGFKGSGATSLVLLIATAIWLTRGESEKRDMDAAKQFFMQAISIVGHTPESVTNDVHRSSPRAIRETMGNERAHRTNVSLNNGIEQDHRGIKQRSYPMRGFGNVASAARFCCAFDEVCQFFRVRSIMMQKVSLAQQCEIFLQRLATLKMLVRAV